MPPSIYLILSRLSSFPFLLSCLFSFSEFPVFFSISSFSCGSPPPFILLPWDTLISPQFFSVRLSMLLASVQAPARCSASLTRFTCHRSHLQHLGAISTVLSKALWYFLINPGGSGGDGAQPAKHPRTNGECRYPEQEPTSAKQLLPFPFTGFSLGSDWLLAV